MVYQENELPSTEGELFQMDNYPLLASNLETATSIIPLEEILRIHYQSLMNAEQELTEAYAAKDWKKIKCVAGRELDGALYSGTDKLRYACQFLERSIHHEKTALLEPLYEQMLKVIAQTKQSIIHRYV